jgi:cytochrome b561
MASGLWIPGSRAEPVVGPAKRRTRWRGPRNDQRWTAVGMRVNDTSSGYGWISIALHWLAAIVVLTMFVIGTMSQGATPEDHLALVQLHTTIGMTAYVLLWGRIVWRFAVGHPGPLPKQGVAFFTIGKYFHFVLLTAIAAMLLSGPLMVWSGGEAIHVFAATIPSPVDKLPRVQHALRAVHGYTASFILAAMILHVLAVFKHTVLNRDGTFDKIMIANGGRNDRLVAGTNKAKA